MDLLIPNFRAAERTVAPFSMMYAANLQARYFLSNPYTPSPVLPQDIYVARESTMPVRAGNPPDFPSPFRFEYLSQGRHMLLRVIQI